MHLATRLNRSSIDGVIATQRSPVRSTIDDEWVKTGNHNTIELLWPAINGAHYHLRRISSDKLATVSMRETNGIAPINRFPV